MAYHQDTQKILQWLGYSLFDGIEGDFTLNTINGELSLTWYNTDPEDPYYPGGPSEQDILDQIVPWKKSLKLDELDTEYLRRIALVNSHIASGGLDGLEWAEATLKASREVAEQVGRQVMEWTRANTALNPTDQEISDTVNVEGPEFVSALETQTELEQILALRSTYIASKAAINALTTEAELDAYDVTTTPGWPA